MPIEKYFRGKGRKVMKAMKEQYGEEKGKQVFYATANKKGVAASSPEYKRLMMNSTPDNSNAPGNVDDTFSKEDMAKGYKTLFSNDKLHSMEVDRWTDETLAERRNPGHLRRSDVEEKHGQGYMPGKKRWRHEEVAVDNPGYKKMRY